ncbi:hypothetical protein DFR62_0252 [Planococcus citreus]|uniref:Uncharacterized protein n=2 Tax=Planococcus citreus TaxID=1373 RepID=A0A497YK48_9BACL|nr:hypothetical protein DFR62_0252 [Planococcus citreus]
MSRFSWLSNINMDKFFKSRLMLVIIFSFIALAVLNTAITVPGEDLKDTLQNSAQLTITVALGISALVFALNVQRNRNRKSLELLEEMIAFILLSLLSYYLSFSDTDYVQRLYIGLGGLMQLAIIARVYSVALDKPARRMKPSRQTR